MSDQILRFDPEATSDAELDGIIHVIISDAIALAQHDGQPRVIGLLEVPGAESEMVILPVAEANANLNLTPGWIVTPDGSVSGVVPQVVQ